MASPFRRTAILDIPPAAFRVLELSGLDAKIGERAGELGHGERKWLELSMVLAAEPAIIFLDEPTAGLSAADRNRAGEVLIELVRRHKLGLLLIEHDLDFVKSIAQRLTVLGNGRILSDGAVAAVICRPPSPDTVNVGPAAKAHVGIANTNSEKASLTASLIIV
jgi:branched-chain amino acid transport system permease protein